MNGTHYKFDNTKKFCTIKAARQKGGGHTRKYKGEIVTCTRQYFVEDNFGVRIMDGWADKNGEISNLAEELSSRQVSMTSCKPNFLL